jgi:P27 family predicted phage terminase small subunit
MKNLPKPPKTLSAAAKRWWRQLQDEYSINDSGGLLILTSAAEAFDRMKQAQDLIASEGMTIVDRFSQQKVHPAILIERDSRSAMLAGLKQLCLDLEPLEARPGRPSGSR